MEPTKVLNGSTGFAAMCFARSVFVNQIAFTVGRALNTKENTAPKFDAAVMAELDEILGGNGLQQPTKLDAEELIHAHAAAFILLDKCIGQPDPDTGRKPEHLIKRRVPLPDAVVGSVERLTEYNLTQGRAEAKKFNADFTAREAAIRAAGEAETRRQINEVKGPWLTAVKALRDADTEELIDTVLVAVVNAGMDPAKEITRAADLMRDSMKARMERGEFAKMDSSIYALCTVAP
jgi:hypothetical protein